MSLDSPICLAADKPRATPVSVQISASPSEL